MKINPDLTPREALRLWHVAGIRITRRNVRTYKRLWARMRREDSDFRIKEALKSKAWREKHKQRAANGVKRWKKQNATLVRGKQREYDEKCVRFCALCGARGKRGMGALRSIVGVFMDMAGNRVKRSFLACRKCMRTHQ